MIEHDNHFTKEKLNPGFANYFYSLIIYTRHPIDVTYKNMAEYLLSTFSQMYRSDM